MESKEHSYEDIKQLFSNSLVVCCRDTWVSLELKVNIASDDVVHTLIAYENHALRVDGIEMGVP